MSTSERACKLSVVGPFSTIIGGAEVVKAKVADILARNNYKVILAGLSYNCFLNLKYTLGYDALAYTSIYTLTPWFPQLLGLLQPFFGIKSVEKSILKYDPNLVFIDMEGSRTLDKLWKGGRFNLVKYINFPHSVFLIAERDLQKIPEEYLVDIYGYTRKYRSHVLLKTYWKGYLLVLERNLPCNPFEADALIANSKYIATLIKEIYGTEPPVIHPPVDTSHIEPYALNPFEERENAVAMLGRLSSEKNFEEVIEAVSKTDTKPTLKIIGAVTRRGWNYVKSLAELARKQGVRVKFYLNLPRDKLGKVLGSCRAFVHATRGEHFGIAVVEAMAAGLPVIVHKSGGQYVDIIDRGKYGLYYSTVEELARNIDHILNNVSSWKYYSALAIQRSKTFGPEIFERQLISLLKAKSII